MHILFQYVASVFDTFATLCTPTPWTECQLQKDDSQSRAEVHKWALVYTNTLNIIKRMCHPVLFPWFRISFLLVFPFDSKQRKKKRKRQITISERCSWLAVHVCVLISPTCLPCLFLHIHVCSGIVAMARFHAQPLLCGMCQHAHMPANSTLSYCPFIHLPLRVAHQTQRISSFYSDAVHGKRKMPQALCMLCECFCFA